MVIRKLIHPEGKYIFEEDVLRLINDCKSRLVDKSDVNEVEKLERKIKNVSTWKDN